MKIKRVKEIKKLIDDVILPGYTYKTNFNCAEFLIDINFNLIIAAKLIRYDDSVEYQFILDTQFLSNGEVTFDEIKMIGKIIDILEDNKKFVLSRLKKYTVKEYDAEIERRERESKQVMDSLMKLIENKKTYT